MAEQSTMKGAAGAADPYPRQVQAWATVIILLLLYVTSLLDRNIITLLGEQIRTNLGLSDIQLSLLFGPAFALSYAIGALPLGWAMDRYSRRWVLWAGVTVWSLATMACGLSRSFTQLFAARTFVGAGEAVLVPGNQSILADMFPPDRLTFPISVYTLGSKFGQGLSLMIGGLLASIIAPAALFTLPLIGDLWGWQTILVIVGLPGILIALLIFLVPEPLRRRVRSAATDSVGYIQTLAYMKKNARFFIGIVVGTTMASTLVGAIMAWTPTYFIRVHGLSAQQVGWWQGVALLTGPVFAMPLHGLIADWLFRRGASDAHTRYLVYTCLIAVPLLVGAYLSDNHILAFTLFSLGYGIFGAFAALVPTAAQLMVPGDMRGKVASAMLVVTSVAGLSIGPPVTAWVSQGLFQDPKSIGMALAVVVAVGLPLTALLYWVTWKPLKAALGGEVSSRVGGPAAA